MPGDREVDLKRVEAAVHPAAVALFEADDFAANPGWSAATSARRGCATVAGYLRYLADPRVAAGTSWLTGANGRPARDKCRMRPRLHPGRHNRGGRGAARRARVPSCGQGELTMRRGIEIGHIFQLGRRFADAFGLDALGPDSKPIRITMGSYGIGVSRLVAAIAEQHHDGKAWSGRPRSPRPTSTWWRPARATRSPPR